MTKEPAADLTKKMIDLCAEEGLLVGSVGVFGNVLRIAPPLVINEAEANESLDLFAKAVARL
jgi:4-aminobutyrate aminotransferase/(S)-3-amino-2-methylpropionate transaminase